MFHLTVDVAELVLRAACVYVYLFVWLRISGKKLVGEMTPFDLVVLLILSETTQNALVADDTSLLGMAISAGALLAIQHVVNYVSWRSRRARRFFDGVPRILVRHGKTRAKAMGKERITVDELLEALRENGITSISSVRVAVLETDGQITVIKAKD